MHSTATRHNEHCMLRAHTEQRHSPNIRTVRHASGVVREHKKHFSSAPRYDRERTASVSRWDIAESAPPPPPFSVSLRKPTANHAPASLRFPPLCGDYFRIYIQTHFSILPLVGNGGGDGQYKAKNALPFRRVNERNPPT